MSNKFDKILGEYREKDTSVSVSSLNSLTGAVTLAAGTNISLSLVGNTITISASDSALGTVTSVASADGSITVTNPTTSVDLSVVKAPKLTTARTISITGDIAYTSGSFDGSANVTGVGTLASIISAAGPIGSATVTPIITYDAKGRLTAVSSATITPAASSITGGAALTKTDDTNVTLTLGGSPSTALLAASSLTLGWTGTLSTARGGTGNATGTATINANLTGPITSVGNATSVASQTGTGTTFVMNTAPQVTILGIGTAAVSSQPITTSGSVGGGGAWRISHTNTNSAGFVDFFMFNDAGKFNGFQLSGSTTSASQFGSTSVNYAKFASSGDLFGIGTSVASPMIFATNDAERVRILSTGEFGIGTLVPSVMFSIAEKFLITSAGINTKYNNISTVSNGIPSELAKVDTTGLTANVGTTTLYAVPSTGAGMYQVCSLVVETTAGSLSSTLPNVQIVYTDNETGGVITIDATPVLGVAGIGQTGALTANTVGTTSTGVIVINAKASTNISYLTTNYASNLAGMTYAIHLKLLAL